MYEIKQLKEELGQVDSDIRALAAEGEKAPFSDEQIERFDSLDSKKQELTQRIATAERLDRSRGNKPNTSNVVIRQAKPQNRATSQDAFRAFLLNGSAGASHMVRQEWTERAMDLGYNLNASQLIQRVGDPPFAGQDLGTQGHGQETIDGDIFVGLMTRLKAFGGMRSVADVFTSSTGNPIHYAFADDVANSGSIVGENAADTSVPIAYAPVNLTAFTYRSGVWPVSWQLIQDSRIDIVADITRKLAIRIGRRQNLDFTSGVGTTTPKGIVPSLDSGMVATAATAAKLTYNDLCDLIHTVDPMYRDEECYLMMHDSTAAYLEQNLIDDNKRPLWLGPASYGNVAEAAPARIAIMGRTFPIVINQAMPEMGQTSTSCVLFGWFKSYKVRDVADLRIEVLRERYADLAAVGVQAYARADAALIDKYAIAGLKMKASQQ